MYSSEEQARLVEHVCTEIAAQRPLYKVLLEDEGMPSRQTFHRWCLESDEINDKVTRARELGMEANIEQMIEIADDRESDPDASSRKTRMFAREKAAQMLAPRRFGNKLDLSTNGKDLPAAQVTVLQDNRVQSLMTIVQQRLRDQAAIEDMMK